MFTLFFSTVVWISGTIIPPARALRYDRYFFINRSKEGKLAFRRNPAAIDKALAQCGFFLIAETDFKKTTAEILEIYRRRDVVEKIKPEAFEFLFREFTETCAQNDGFYRGYRLLAADGSHVQIAVNPTDADSYIDASDGQKPYSMLHLNTVYDLNRRIYLDAVVQKYRRQNEHKALVTMIDRSSVPSAILLADRGYESYNNMAHCQEKGWKYLFRIRDNGSNMTSCLNLPDCDEFDFPVCLHLTRRQRKSTKHLLEDKNHYRIISASNTFDYLLNP